MKINDKLLRQIISDLGLNAPFVKGQDIAIKNCWHFSTDGNAVDVLFNDDKDFLDGMNRVFVVLQAYGVIILAFSLMDTHVHFVLYGEFEECNRFMHDYMKRTSRYISVRHGERNKTDNVPINYQVVDTAFYLKVVICYTIKNPPVAGIMFNALDYPWSSGPLYFRRAGCWSSPQWMFDKDDLRMSAGMSTRDKRNMMKTRIVPEKDVRMIGDLIFPGEYVAYELVEQLFKTCRSFNFFMCISKEDEVDSRGGIISHLSIPMQEMRQHKNELCYSMYGTESVRTLTTTQRVRLAKALKSKYNSSLKQIIRLSGLVYEEVKNLI